MVKLDNTNETNGIRSNPSSLLASTIPPSLDSNILSKLIERLTLLSTSLENEIRQIEKVPSYDTRSLVVNLSELKQVTNVLKGHMKET